MVIEPPSSFIENSGRDGVDKYTHFEKFVFTDGTYYSSVIASTGSSNGPYLETDVNNAPVVQAVQLAAINEDASITFTAAQLLDGTNIKDADGSTISISSVSVPSSQGIITASGSGTWTFVPAANFNGQATITFVTTDGTKNFSQTASINVNAANDAPAVGLNPVTLTTTEDTSILITKDQLLANISDPEGSTLSITAISVSHGTITNNGNGTWTYTPAANSTSQATISFTVSDGTATTNTNMKVNITAVNDAPVVNAPPSYTTNEDSSGYKFPLIIS